MKLSFTYLFYIAIFLTIISCSQKNEKKSEEKTLSCSVITCGIKQICIAETVQCVSESNKCGNVICKENEQCDPDQKKCEPIPTVLCEQTTCGIGQYCDPKDGKCKAIVIKCEVCNEGQICSAETGTCFTVDKCATITCEEGMVCNEQSGECESSQPKVGSVGAACNAKEDCKIEGRENVRCLKEGSVPDKGVTLNFPSGYCSADCGFQCPDGSICISGAFAGLSFCVDACASNKDCRDGYTCQNLGAASACLAEQSITRECENGCGNVGDECIEDTDCQFGLKCLKDDFLYPSGMCTKTSCDRANNECPLGGECVVLPDETTACFKTCDVFDPKACREEYGCVYKEKAPRSRSKTCSSNTECGSNGYCYDSVCYQECNTIDDCGDNEICETFKVSNSAEKKLCGYHRGYCDAHISGKGGCRFDLDCGYCDQYTPCLFAGPGYQCELESSTCQKSCTPGIESQCSTNQVCSSQGFCLDACQKNEQCESKNCVEGHCKPVSYRCDEVRRVCQASCEGNASICAPNNYSCDSDGVCVKSCSDVAGECGAGGSCQTSESLSKKICKIANCQLAQCPSYEICGDKDIKGSSGDNICITPCKISTTNSSSLTAVVYPKTQACIIDTVCDPFSRVCLTRCDDASFGQCETFLSCDAEQGLCL